MNAPLGLLPLSMYRVTGRRKVPVTPTNETRYRCFRDALPVRVGNEYCFPFHNQSQGRAVMRNQRGESIVGFVALVVIVLFLLLGGVGGCMAFYPKYKVYQQEMSGRAVLAEAEASRQVAVLEAKAKLDAAKNLAGAEVERAKGVAQANKIIGDSLHNNEDYLRYLFVNGLENTKNQVIYVPTEANLPILEASRNQRPVVVQAQN